MPKFVSGRRHLIPAEDPFATHGTPLSRRLPAENAWFPRETGWSPSPRGRRRAGAAALSRRADARSENGQVVQGQVQRVPNDRHPTPPVPCYFLDAEGGTRRVDAEVGFEGVTLARG